MMRKNLLSLSIANVFALATAAPATHAVDMHSRTAAADCMIEAAISIAATIITYKGSCDVGEWALDVQVNESIDDTIPMQGSLTVSGGEDAVSNYKLNGKMAVFNPADDDVNCRVDTIAATNQFQGVPFVYSGRDETSYLDALPEDPDDPFLNVSKFRSKGNVIITEKPRINYLEDDNLTYDYYDDEDLEASIIRATGDIQVLGFKNNRPSLVALSDWVTESEDGDWMQYIPDPVDDEEGLEGWVHIEFISDDFDVDECEIEVEADATITSDALSLHGEIIIEAESAEE